MKNANEPIGNQNRELSACSRVPQPTVSPCIPIIGLAEMHPGATNGREGEKDYGVCVGTERSGEKSL